MKRIATFTLVFLMVLSCALCIPATASTYASKTICSSSGTLNPGDKSGQLKINYTVTANKEASSLGVESIDLYKMNGDHVITLTGNTTNGMVINSDIDHEGTHYYNAAISGQYYYAEVTVFAVIGDDYDSYTHLTETIKAP